MWGEVTCESDEPLSPSQPSLGCLLDSVPISLVLILVLAPMDGAELEEAEAGALVAVAAHAGGSPLLELRGLGDLGQRRGRQFGCRLLRVRGRRGWRQREERWPALGGRGCEVLGLVRELENGSGGL
jgi:hypothetical protein